MAETPLTQMEADALIAVQKRSLATGPVILPVSGRVEVPLSDQEGNVDFQLDIRRSGFDISKGTNQTRVRKTIVLVRLDYGGAPHRNPDGVEVPCPHLHIYRSGYGDKWAYPISTDQFGDVNDFRRTLDDFMIFCNVIEQPEFQEVLF